MQNCSRFLIFAFFFFLNVSAASAAETTLSVVADDWCPYNCTPGSDKPGIMIEIAQKALGKHGIKIDYKILPWTRAIEGTRKGTYNAIVGAANGDAPDFIFPEEPQARSTISFFVKADNPWRYKDMNDFKKVSLGAIAGYAYADDVDKYIEDNKYDLNHVQIISGDSARDVNVKKLLMGRISVLVEDKYVMEDYLDTHDIQKEIVEAGSMPPDSQSALFLAFSPKNSESKRYAEILSSETRAMKESGEISAILKKYGLSPEPKTPSR